MHRDRIITHQNARPTNDFGTSSKRESTGQAGECILARRDPCSNAHVLPSPDHNDGYHIGKSFRESDKIWPSFCWLLGSRCEGDEWRSDLGRVERPTRFVNVVARQLDAGDWWGTHMIGQTADPVDFMVLSPIT